MENHARGRFNGRGRGRGRSRGGSNQNLFRGQENANQNQFRVQENVNQRMVHVSGGSGRGRGIQGTGHGGSPTQTSQCIQFGTINLTDSPRTTIPKLMPESLLPENSKHLPIRRPDLGGRSTTGDLRLFVNHFSVKFNPQKTIYHYDVEIKLEGVGSKNGRDLPISKADMRRIRDKFFSENPREYPLSVTAYDGEKSIFSAIKLRDGRYKVEASRGEGHKPQLYEFTIKLVKELDLQKLQDYLWGRPHTNPREVLQGMDLVMKENATRHLMSIGQRFYARDCANDVDLGGGIIASKGFQHSLKPTLQGLALCVDYSVLPLRKPLPVIEFLEKNLKVNLKVRRIPADWQRSMEKALKGLKVVVTHRRTKQQYKIEGLTRQVARDIIFPCEDTADKSKSRDVRLVDYFRDRYKEIEYLHLPCLDFSKNEKMNYVPMEFCVLIEGQRYPKENLESNAAGILKNERSVKPKKRMQVICDFVKARDGPRGGAIAENFEISVATEMTEVIGRVIKPPFLKLGDGNGKYSKFTLDKPGYQWNLLSKSVLEGKQIERWAVLDFTSFAKFPLKDKRFTHKLMDRCSKLGMHMAEPLFCESSKMEVLSNTIMLRDLLKKVNKRADQAAMGGLQILICVMTKKDSGYKNLKRISETELGIMTQCCLLNHANDGKDVYLANLALKINAKLGGNNFELFDRLPRLEGEGHVMFIGADVNHPGSWNTSSPSIAAVVGSVNWPAANQYAARIRPQHHRAEKIQNFGEICMELIHMYSRLNSVRPQKIVIFRDGVADNQFDMVLNEELTDLKNTIRSEGGYEPSITLVVAQKRHQTRLFLQNEFDVRGKWNPPPGTVVDTIVVSPHEFDFYIITHFGSLGTSRPTHYTVLYDDHKFTSNEMQKLIYNLCYTFARCTKPVSLVPPIYYADLVAYRGRLYHDALMDSSPASTVSSSLSTLSSSSSLSSSSLPSSAGFNSSSFKLHSSLENEMFFC